MLVLWLFLAAALLFLLQRWVYARFWSRKLSVRLQFSSDCIQAGEDAVLTEQFFNRKLLPLPMLRCRYRLLRNFEPVKDRQEQLLQINSRLAVPARRSVRRQTPLHHLQRGIYTVSEGELIGTDLFYTTEERKPFYSGARLTVWPEKLDAVTLSVPYRRLLGAVLTRRATQEDPFEFRGIRPYEIYDSMRMINWKATAKTGELKVNQNDYTTDEALCLILDIEHGDASIKERGISVASSLAERFLHRGVSVSLAANGRSCIGGREIRVPAGSGAAHLRVIDDSLAQLKLGQATRSTEALLEALRDRPVNALCVLISAGGGPGLCSAFDGLCGKDGGFFLQLAEAEVSGKHFRVLPLFEGEEMEVAGGRK